MPGGYAHLTLVNLLNDQVQSLPSELNHAYKKYFHFCELGSMSPDMPYLILGNSDQMAWSDYMHYEKTFEFVKAAAAIANQLSGEDQLKCISWLLGFASHLVMDGTVHPVVELKVGDYEHHKLPHRKCELHQDAYLFPRLGYGVAGSAEPIRSGPKMCSQQGDEKELDGALVDYWMNILERVHPEHFEHCRPQPSQWFEKYIFMLDRVVEESKWLTPLTRHFVVDTAALACPPREAVDFQYIKGLATPSGPQDYDAVIELAVKNVLDAWKAIGEAMVNNNHGELAKIPDFNLDTGKDSNENLVWWA